MGVFNRLRWGRPTAAAAVVVVCAACVVLRSAEGYSTANNLYDQDEESPKFIKVLAREDIDRIPNLTDFPGQQMGHFSGNGGVASESK